MIELAEQPMTQQEQNNARHRAWVEFAYQQMEVTQGPMQEAWEITVFEANAHFGAQKLQSVRAELAEAVAV